MKFNRKVYVVGGANTNFIGKFHPDYIWKKHPDFGKKDNPSAEDRIKEAVNKALDATGVKPAQIERGYLGNFAGELFASQGHMAAMIPSVHPDFVGKSFIRTEAACASGGVAVASCIDALQAGHDVVMAVGAEVQNTVNARIGADYLARAAHYATQRSIDEFTFPCLFARRAKAYKEKWGLTDADIAPVVVKAYGNANKNPEAHMHTQKRDLEWASTASDKNPNFLSNEEYKDHLKVGDCSQVSDGGSALILATEEGLAKLGIDKSTCVEILSCAVSTSPLDKVDDPTVLDNTANAARIAYAEAGMAPKDIDVAEVHDCFSVTEVLMYEALGFADKGKGTDLLKSGATAIEGSIPVNTGGGLIAFGHPVGATGVKQVVEITKQLKGAAGDYQVPGSPKIGLTANMGGDDRTSVVMILKA